MPNTTVIDPAFQTTIKSEVHFNGTGLHLGEQAQVTLQPAAADTGIVFIYQDSETQLSPENCVAGTGRTIVKTEQGDINTVEHLLAAIHGLCLDNVRIILSGAPEIPGLDGSALPFAQAIQQAGLEQLTMPAKIFALAQPVSVSSGDAVITAYPASSLYLGYILDYKQSNLAKGVVDCQITPASFIEQIAPCRTFVLKDQIEPMLAAGLGKGSSHATTMVIDGDKLENGDERRKNECAGHKALDLLGDSAVLGMRLQMRIVSYKGGHELNHQLMLALAKKYREQTFPRGIMDINGILKILPHRYPFLLVDRVLEVKPRKFIRTLKNLTRNEEFFNGHFPGQPIMPGVLQLEAMAQSGALLLINATGQTGKLAVLAGANDVKYRRPVVPGDQLIIEVEIERFNARLGLAKGRCLINNEVASEATIKFALVDSESFI